MKALTENDCFDLTEIDYDFLQDREPDATISTGFDTTFATELEIYFTDKTTIVVPRGEHENCEGWKFEKRVTPKAALKLYRKECAEEEAEDNYF